MINKSYLDSRVFGSRQRPPEDTDRNAWSRELMTAKEIVKRFKKQPGVLLADDTGLGKTWVAALAALAIADNGCRILVLVPNKTMIGKWERDLYKVRSLLWDDNAVRIRRLDSPVQRLREKNIAIATHHHFFQYKFPNVTADLLIVDEAHRSKDDESVFRRRLREKSNNFQGFLFLTATPFSISVKELISIINMVSGSQDQERESAVRSFANFAVKVQGGDCNKNISEAKECWNAAVSVLKPWVIRHTIAGLGSAEKKSFGKSKEWTIEVPLADKETIEILVRADRLLNLRGGPKEIKGFRGSDPRYHVGWQYLQHLLADDLQKLDIHNKLPEELKEKNDRVLKHIKTIGILGDHHLNEIRDKLEKIDQHPKIKSVVAEVTRQVLEAGEKVVVFCHHIATMYEVTAALNHYSQLNKSIKVPRRGSKGFLAWKGAWKSLLESHSFLKGNEKDKLRQAILNWVECPAFRRQVKSWLSSIPETELEWKYALKKTRVRGITDRRVPTILKAVLELAQPERHFEENIETEEETVPKIFYHTSWTPVTNAQSEDLDAKIALFNTPFGPDVLVATDRLSEGIDLHKCCRLLVHYEFDPSPIRIRQREGRIRRVKGWAQRIGKPIEYAYPIFSNTRDELLVRIVKDRLERFDLLLGGASSVDIGNIDIEASRSLDANLLDLLKKMLGNEALNCLAVSFCM